MPNREAQLDQDETIEAGEDQDTKKRKNPLDELDAQAKTFLSTFSTIRSKIDDVIRAESDIKRFELSIEADRKRLQKNLESAKEGLRSARVQMAVELTKLDSAGFSEAAAAIKERHHA